MPRAAARAAIWSECFCRNALLLSHELAQGNPLLFCIGLLLRLPRQFQQSVVFHFVHARQLCGTWGFATAD